jgi:hypothetical protein
MKTILLFATSLLLSACLRAPQGGPIATEQQYYKQMYEQAVVSTTNANTLTQWTLGSVATVIALVIGAQILFNYRLGRQELLAIQRTLEAQIATNQASVLQTLDERNQALSIELRNAISRELDAYNAAARTALSTYQAQLQEGLSNQFELSRDLVSAEKLFAKEDYLNAFRTMLGVAETRLAQKPSDGNVGYMLWPFLKALQEIQENDLKRLTALIEQLKGGGTLSYSYLADSLGKLKIYRLGRSGNEYLPNPFAPSA